MTVINNRYEIGKPLGHGAMGTVFLAFDRVEQRTVALKRVTWQRYNFRSFSAQTTKQATLHLNEAITREFEILSQLRHPNIVSVMDYGLENNQPYLVMEILPDAQTITEAARALSIEQKIVLICQLLYALDYLNHHQVIHRDLKPNNILVVAGQVKVLDFGIATQPANDDLPVGSLAYMSPERLKGGKATAQSDLYAVGIIFYEILAGRLPFIEDSRTTATLVQQVIQGALDTNSLGPLAPFVTQLTALDPLDRPATPYDALLLLSVVSPFPIRIQNRPENTLNAAPFVGRETELAILKTALQQAVQGHGQAIMIQGENGIGKSRLLREFSSYALLSGASVISSQEVDHNISIYEAWNNIIRRLLLQNEPLDSPALQELGSILPGLNLTTNQSDHLNRDTDFKHHDIAAAVLSVFLKIRAPTVVILEDLHKTAKGSIELFRFIAEHLDKIPVVFIASAQLNQSNQNTIISETSASNIQSINLERLDRKTIEQLSMAVLGDLRGSDTALIDFIQSQTDGNILSIVELLRSVANEAGSLQNISAHIAIRAAALDFHMEGKRKYKAFEPESELVGTFVLSLIKSLNYDKTHDILVRHHLTEIVPAQWYNLQDLLDILSEVANGPNATDNLLTIGLAGGTISWQESPEQLRKLSAEDWFSLLCAKMHRSRHRNYTGSFTFEKHSETHFSVTTHTPYPDDMLYGLLYAFLRNYVSMSWNFKLTYDETIPRRDEGGAITIFHIQIIKPNPQPTIP